MKSVLLISILAAASLVIASADDAPPIKKGIGSWNPKITVDKLSRLHVSWYYTWSLDPKSDDGSRPMEFVPMFWNGNTVTPENIRKVKDNRNVINVLGFNEPDHPDQSNMTVDQCLALWPQIMSTGKRLGSPAPGGNLQWLDEFMSKADKLGYRVDFIALHKYPDYTNPKAVDEFEHWLIAVHDKYHKPIWVTEFGTADVTKWHLQQKNKPSEALAEAFLVKTVKMLERLDFVERYAWFADNCEGEYSLSPLYQKDGDGFTEMGKLYKDANGIEGDNSPGNFR